MLIVGLQKGVLMVCEKCRQREATVHITTITGGSTTTVNLCPQCSGQPTPELASLLQNGCHYCGGAFHCTVPDLAAQSSGKEKSWALCERCAAEFYGFCQRKLPGLATGAMTPEQISELPGVLAELDSHMKTWVSQRDSR